jgi:Ca2+-binding EF-hand superfamily protein
MDELKANKKGLRSIFNALSGSIPIPPKPSPSPGSLTEEVIIRSRRSL